MARLLAQTGLVAHGVGAPGTDGQVLTSTGTVWNSEAAVSGAGASGDVVNTQYFTHATRFVPDDTQAVTNILEFTTALVKKYDASTSYLLLFGTIPAHGENHAWSGCITTVVGGGTTTASAYGFLFIGSINAALTGIQFTHKLVGLPAFTGGSIHWGTSSANSSFYFINPNSTDNARVVHQTASQCVAQEVMI